MNNLDMKVVEEAVNEAVDKAIQKFGIGYVRKLSMFPSARARVRHLDKVA
jgi:hypothetical protein